MVEPFVPLNFEVVRIRRTHEVINPDAEVLYDDLGNEIVPDELGNETITEVEDIVAVAGWGQPAGTEPKLAGHDRRTVEVELFAPVGAFRALDAVRLPDHEGVLEVIGEPGNFEHNPFGWAPGLEVVNLGGVS